MKLSLQSCLAIFMLGCNVAGGYRAAAQTANISVADEKWKAGGAFEGYKPNQEVLEKRNKWAKHFRNPNGSFTVQTGNIYHYKDDKGSWQDIDLNLKLAFKAGVSFINETNEYKVAFPSEIGGRGITMKANAIDFTWWANPEIRLKANGQADKVLRASVAGIQQVGNVLDYKVYNDIVEQFVVLQNGIENNTIIDRLNPAMQALPGDGQIEFKQFIPLKAGWKVDKRGTVMTSSFTTSDFHIDVPGTEMGVFFSPIIAFDNTLTQQQALYNQYAPEEKLTAAERLSRKEHLLQCDYRVDFVAGGINVSYLVPAAWLKAGNRTYPVTIDPVVTFTPAPIYSGGYFYTPMSHWYGFQRHADLYLNSELGISNVNITDVEYQRMSTSGTNAVKPAKVFMRTTTATTLTGTDAWNSTTYIGGLTPLYNASADFHGTTIGWKMMTLSTPFLYSGNNLLVMVYDEYGGSGSAKYLNMSNAFATSRQAYKRQDATDPGDASTTAVESKLTEIRLTYVPAGPTIPNCLASPISPSNGAIGVCNGTTMLRWNKPAWATGFDVYFNTGTTATTQVATNIADTFFAVTTAIGSHAWRIVPRNSLGIASGCNTFTFVTVPGITPATTIAVTPNDTICSRSMATFTATSVYGGSAPVYQWKRNNVNVGTNSPTYSTGTLVNKDTIQVVMTSNNSGCVSEPVAPSNKIIMTVLPAPATTITASGPVKFCYGGSVTLTAPAGATAYQWYNMGGSIAGANTASYVATFGDSYTVAVHTPASACPAVADSIKITVHQLPYPALITNGTTLSTQSHWVTYQWYNRTTPIPGATTNSYTYTGDGDYSVKVTDTLTCEGQSFILPIRSTGVNPTATATYSIYPNPASGLVMINTPKTVNIMLRSVDGKVVMVKNDVTSFDVSSLANGVYTLYINSRNNELLKVEKLVKRSE